ncbi:MAG: hypothetical protein AB7P17_02050 [Nitrospirales bacterium]|nr:hypothetical protein [Nitrospirales bacterium]
MTSRWAKNVGKQRLNSAMSFSRLEEGPFSRARVGCATSRIILRIWSSRSVPNTKAGELESRPVCEPRGSDRGEALSCYAPFRGFFGGWVPANTVAIA